MGTIHGFDNQTLAAQAAGKKLGELLVINRVKPVLLLLSGGSALKILSGIDSGALAKNLTITMLDERFSSDLLINNFSQLQKTRFYGAAVKAEANFFGSLPMPNETMEQLAGRMEKNLRQWKNENPNGIILATFGMGQDGHTAGIFPCPEDPAKFHQLFESANWLAAYSAEGKHKYPDRVTATLTFFKLIDEAVVYVCGAEKKEKFEILIKKSGSLAELPALGICQTKHFQIFTDLE